MVSAGSRQLITYFFTAYRSRSAVLVALLCLAGLAEALGVATLLPLLDSMGSDRTTESPAGRAVSQVLSVFGAEMSLLTLLVMIVVALSLKAAFRLLAMHQVGYTVARVATDLRLRLLRALSESSWPYFVDHKVGRFANAVGNEAARAATAYRSACTMFAAFVQVLVYAGIAMVVSWRVALLAVAAGAFMMIVLSRAVHMSREAGRRQTQAMKALTSRITDALSGIKAIKAMGQEEHLQPLLEHETNALKGAQQRQVLAGELLTAPQEPLLAVLLAVGIYIGVTVFALPMGYVFVLGFLFYRLAGRISAMQTEYQVIANGEAAFTSLFELTQSASDARERTDGSVIPTLERGVTFDRVSFAYGDNVVLSEASMVITAGEFVTLVGPSGAGKTTTVDLLIGFLAPDRGHILVDGHPLNEVDLKAWRRFVGYVPQETFLFHDSLRENVTLGDPGLSDADVLRALKLAGAESVVQGLPSGLDTQLGERGSRLSGGQRQRVGLARALVRQPRLLILDEVTSALDLATEREICRTLKDLPEGVTVIAISHREAFVSMASSIVKVSDGRFEEQASGEAALLMH